MGLGGYDDFGNYAGPSTKALSGALAGCEPAAGAYPRPFFSST